MGQGGVGCGGPGWGGVGMGGLEWGGVQLVGWGWVEWVGQCKVVGRAGRGGQTGKDRVGLGVVGHSRAQWGRMECASGLGSLSCLGYDKWRRDARARCEHDVTSSRR